MRLERSWMGLTVLREGLEIVEEEGRWVARFEGKSLLLPSRPEGPLMRDFLNWADGRMAGEASPLSWFWDREKLRRRAEETLLAALEDESARLGGLPFVRECLFELAVFAACCAWCGKDDLLDLPGPSGKTPLQSWGAVFYALFGPRRVSLARVGGDGRGLGGSLFTSRYLEEWWRQRGKPLPVGEEFLSEVRLAVSSFGWVGESEDQAMGASLDVLGRVGEAMGLGREAPVAGGLGLAVPVEGGFGGGPSVWAAKGVERFAAICRTRAEWTSCRARAWALWPSELPPLDLDQVIHLAPQRPLWPVRESQTCELKAGWEWDPKLRRVNGDLRLAVVRSVAGMLNASGGEVVLGVKDDGEAVGLGQELGRLKGKNPLDALEQKVREALRKRLRPHPLGLVSFLVEDFHGALVVRLTVQASSEPVELVEKDQETGELRVSLYVRDGCRVLRLSEEEARSYLRRRFGG